MDKSDIQSGAQELMEAYGPAALCIAAERAEFAVDRRDFYRQKYWTEVYDTIRRTPVSNKEKAALPVASIL